jgi:DNA-binding NtrC family response regulator/tetratricopeptide (TPR) repeat protein
MEEIKTKLAQLKQAGKLDRIRLYGEIIALAPGQAPDRLLSYFDELLALYRDYRKFDPKPPAEVLAVLAKSLQKVFTHIRITSDLAAFDKYEPVFRELEPCLPDPLDKARIYQVFGYINWMKNEIEASLRYLTESLRIATQSGITDDLPERYTNLGYVYEYIGDYRKAEKYYKDGLKFAQQNNYEEALIKAYSGLGRLNLRLRKYQLAIQYMEMNLALIGDNAMSGERLSNLTNLASAYKNSGNVDKALELTLQLDQDWIRERDPDLYYSNISNIGSVYFEKKDYATSETYYLKAFDYAKRSGDIPLQICALINLGHIGWTTDRLPEAVDYLQAALVHVQKTQNQRQELEVHISLGDIYLQMQDYQKAIGHFEQAGGIAETISDPSKRLEATRSLALCHEKLGGYEQAYRLLRASLELKEEIDLAEKEPDEELKSRKVVSSGKKTNYIFSDSMSLISSELSGRIGHWLIGSSPQMREVVERAYIAARNETVNVMVYGESGTGKELIARLIHHSGKRAEHPFVEVNSAVFTTSLAESSLFGHRKGAFTGANENHLGYFESAHRGTLFLDEISEMPPEIQSMLLRVLETKQVKPLGSNSQVRVDFRLICATNHQIAKLVEKKEFRFDLFNRVNALEIHLPPLRERRSDIPLLVNYYLTSLSREMNLKMPAVSQKALDKLCGYPYPGNVRELKNLVQRLLLFGKNDTIEADDVTINLDGKAFESAPLDSLDLEENEKRLILLAMNKAGNVAANAARLLNISPYALSRRIRKYGLNFST